MMKRMVYVLVLAALALAACTPAAATEAPGGTSAEGLPDLGGREVTVAVENAYLPFNYIDPVSAEPAGWDYEVWNEMCRLLNCVPVYTEAAWEGMIQAVADGQFDAAADGITITDERDQIVDFSDGLHQRRSAAACPQGRGALRAWKRSSPMSLTVSTQTGTTNYRSRHTVPASRSVSAFEQFRSPSGADQRRSMR
jgi:polar amino acid transport system substrate-binding protein